MNFLEQKKINFKFLSASLLLLLLMYFVNINSGSYFLKKLSESIFFIAIPIAIFSIITLFVHNSLFLKWIKMTKYFLFSSLLIILITPTSSHGLDFLPIVKEIVAIILSVLYSFISLFFIIFQSIKPKKQSN